MNARGEALLAAIGLEPFLGDDPVRITQAHRADAAKMQRFADPQGLVIAPAPAVRSELREFLTAEEWAREKTLPEFKYRRALEVLTEPPETLTARIPGLIQTQDDEEKAALVLAVTAALDYLRTLLPRHSRQTPTGPVQLDPNAAILGIFRRSWGVANRPMVVLEDLNEGVLARDQVRALQTMFPTLYTAIKDEIIEVMADHKAKHPKFELPHKRSKQLSVLLLDAGVIDKSLAQVMQKNFAEAEAQEAGKKVEAGAEAHDLPTRKIEAR